jgi:hypothetical protein
MSLKRLIAAAALAGALCALAPANAEGALPRKQALSVRPADSISLNRYTARPRITLRSAMMVMFSAVICSRGHCGIIEL